MSLITLSESYILRSNFRAFQSTFYGEAAVPVLLLLLLFPPPQHPIDRFTGFYYSSAPSLKFILLPRGFALPKTSSYEDLW